jgi:hypothetical protein
MHEGVLGHAMWESIRLRLQLHALLSMPEAFPANCAVHDLRRMPLVATISRFHIQILQLFAFVLIWVHWDACLQYGACAAQPASRWGHHHPHPCACRCQACGHSADKQLRAVSFPYLHMQTLCMNVESWDVTS